MPLLERILTPINALLPDISHVPQRRQAVGAVVASLVLHLILLLLFVAFAAIIPDRVFEVAEAAPAEPPPLEVQIMPAPTEEEFMTPEELEKKLEGIDSSGLAEAKEAPTEAKFASDQNMKAASELPARGNEALPSQDGSAQTAGIMFKGQNSRLGRVDGTKEKVESSPDAAPEVAEAPAAPAMESPSKVEAPVEDTKKAREVAEPKPDEIAIAQKLKPRISSPDVALRPLPAASERQEMAKLATPSPKRGKNAKYQGSQWETRVDGNITNRGRKAVDAVKTPRGVYTKNVAAQIGSRWTYFVRTHPDRYAFGLVQVRFLVSRDGTVSNVEVVENTANDAFAMMCQQSVFEAEIAPVPEDVYPVMTNGKFEMTLTFHYVPFQ